MAYGKFKMDKPGNLRKPGKGNGDRVTIMPVNPRTGNGPVKPRAPRPGGAQTLPGRKFPGNGTGPVKPSPKPITKKPRGEGGKTTVLSDWARRERQLPSRVTPGTRKKSGDMGSRGNNGRIRPGARGR